MRGQFVNQSYRKNSKRGRPPVEPPLPPPYIGDLEHTLDVLVSALIEYRQRREPSVGLQFYSLQTLMTTPDVELRARDWIEAPIDLAFKHALRDVMVIVAPRITNAQLGSMIERVAAADHDSYGQRYAVLEKAANELRTIDDAIWLS